MGDNVKIRTGFVSNSSTSSFVIHVPQGATEEQMRIMIEKYIGISDTCFLKGFKKIIIDTILKYKGEKVDIQKRLEAEKRDLKDGKEWGSQERVDKWQNIVDKNIDIYQGGFSDDAGDPIQDVLCNAYFKIDKENFFMENDNEY